MITRVKETIDTQKPIYKDGSFTLYKVSNPDIQKGTRPLILVSGNSENTYLPNGKAKTSSVLVLNEKGFSHSNQPYETELHQPYVAVLSYNNHPENTASMFAESLGNALKQNNLKDCDVIGKSLGGLITLEMMKQNPDLVNHAYLLNTPIYGSILAERDFLRKELEMMKDAIKQHGINGLKEVDRTLIDRIIADLSLGGSREDCATTKDNAKGIEKFPNLDKFTYFAGNIFDKSQVNYKNDQIMWAWYEQIQRLVMEYSARYMERSRGIESDGTITFDSKRIKHDGIDFVNCPGIDHSKLSSSGYLDHAYQEILERNKSK